MTSPSNQRGQTLPLAALAMVVLLGTAGFAVDAGYHQYQQRMQQTATDSAALAGAEELLIGDSVAAGRKDAATNGFSDNTGQATCPASPSVGTVCVEIHNPPQAGDAYAATSKAVEADITAYHPTFFESVFNISNVPVTTKAVAVLVPQNSAACMYVLNGSANFNGQTTNGNPVLNAPNCGLEFNGSVNFHAMTVTAAQIGCVDAASCLANGTFTSATPAPIAPVTDPCGGLSFCAHMASQPPACTSPVTPPADSSNATITLSPGCYNGMTYNKASTVTFNCGLYVITGVSNISANGQGGQININQSSSCSTGTTFYVTGGGKIQWKNANISLAAPTAGDYSQYSAGEQNTLIYQNPSDTSDVLMQAASCGTCGANLTGMIYAPNSNFNYNQGSATASAAPLIIVGSLNFNGGSTTIFSVPGGGVYITDIAVLGE